MIPTTTTPTTRATTAAASAPAASDHRVVVRSSRTQLVVGGALVLATVGVAVGVALTVRSAGGAGEVAAPTTAAVATYAVGDAAHGGPGSRAGVLRAAPAAAAPSAAVTGETAHGGPGSRTDAVRPLAPRPSDVRVADVAHGSAGYVVTATAARP